MALPYSPRKVVQSALGREDFISLIEASPREPRM